MKKIILGGIVTLSTLSTLKAQFPYNNPLTSTSNVTTSGSGVLYQATEGGIILTKGQNSSGGIILNGVEFSTEKGFNIDFTYTLHKDIESNNFGAAPGVGFSFILFNSTNPNPNLGSFNGALGYAYNATYQTGRGLGFSDAYLSIGFDIVGMNKALMAEYGGNTFGYQYRAGIPNLTSDQIYNGSNVTIRGPVNKGYTIKNAISSYTAIYGGYPVLISQATNYKTADVPSRYVLNTSTGAYTSSNDLVNGGNFNIMTDEYTADPTNPNYRRALISMLPSKDTSGNVGFYINVSVYYGNQFTTVIKDFFVNSSSTSTVTYPDLTEGQTSAASTNISTVMQTMTLAPPSGLGAAIAASAGEGYAIISAFSNVNITLPYAPILPDVGVSNVCSVAKRSTTFSVLDNAIGYDNDTYTPSNPPVGKRNNINQASFQFRSLNSDGSFTDTSNPYVCTTTAGRYTYNPSTGNIIFIASAKAASLTQDIVYYTIKNKLPSDATYAHLADDDYRSRTAKATLMLDATDCPPIPNVHVKINK